MSSIIYLVGVALAGFLAEYATSEHRMPVRRPLPAITQFRRAFRLISQRRDVA